MQVSTSELRANIYRLLDQVIETGEPLEIARKGRVLKIIGDQPRAKLSRLRPHPGFMKDTPDSYIHMDWSEEWRP
jgi:antitoxin (DNA-binding transcriptional repressor) of toxin-antitoxin stability system